MDDANARAEEQASGPETPEDVAILYSWANLPGAKYRDFSASRREYRAQQRARAAEAQRQAELEAARVLEMAAQREIEEAQRQLQETQKIEAKAAADAEDKRRAKEALRQAEERAEQERQEALRRQRSAEELRQRAERAEQEMLEARKRAEEQAARYNEADAQHQPRPETEGSALPGEITDPYYYTGHVDPAYFAPTPGVRTAQAARVSTERKAYVYPMHPGSDEYDAGTIVPYRAAGVNFAPSPAQGFGHRSSPLKEEGTGSTLEGFFASDSGRNMFAPTPKRAYPTSRETVAPDLHIRPATLAGSGESGSYASPPRLSPLPLLSVPDPMRGSLPGRPMLSSAPESEAGVPRARESKRSTASEARGSEPSYEAKKEGAAGRLAPIRSEAADDSDEEGRSSRMFIPSPRRRVLTPVATDTANAPAEMPAEPGSRTRDADAETGERLAQAETAARDAQDRFVRQQATDLARTQRVLDEEEPSPLASVSAMEDHAGNTGEWHSASRFGDMGLRRRREPGNDAAARTVRQRRVVREPEMLQEPASSDAKAEPPAWLSAERPAAMRPEAEEAVTGPSGRYAPVESSMTATPRAVPRPQPQPAPARDQAAVSPTSGEKHLPSPWRGAADLRPAQAEGTPGDTLQQSRERVASRWFALSGLMGSEDRRSQDLRLPKPGPALSVLSISGGVGKTSIVATLGRALSSVGEKVLLADTHVHGILPYYFGAREQRPGTVRTFTPPPGSSDAPVVLVSYDAEIRGHDEAAQARVLEDLQRRAQEAQRVLLDLSINSAWLARKVAGANPWVLVPVAPDMNSVIGTQAVERLFQQVTDVDGKPVKPYYVLNQYDPTLPLHLDVREVLRQFLGERLLPIMLHRTPAVSEALAEGMTVMDYAPGSPIAEDYMNLATWVRHLAEPGISYARPARWSER